MVVAVTTARLAGARRQRPVVHQLRLQPLAAIPHSPAPPSPGDAIILPARRGRIYMLFAGVAVFTPAAVAALLFTSLVVLLLASSTVVSVADKQIIGVWPPIGH